MVGSKYWDMSPQEFIRQLFHDTVNGEMKFTHHPWPCGEPYDSYYPITWSKSEAEELVERYDSLTQAITRFGKLHDKIQDENGGLALLTEHELEVWNTFLKPYDAYEEVDAEFLDQIYDMDMCGAELDEEEHDILERHYEWREEQCLKRLPYDHYTSIDFIESAMDYERCVRIDVSEDVLRDYGRWLAYRMIFYYHYDKSREKVFTLEDLRNGKGD